MLIVGFETTTTSYEALYTSRAVGGIGSYNVSLTQTTILYPTALAIFVSELYLDVFQNVQMSTYLPPHSCSGDGCLSTFILASLALVQPPPLPPSNYPKADSIFIHRLQGVQVEFWNSDQRENFTSNNCKIWGSNESAIEICIGQSFLDKNHLVAGLRAYNVR